MYSKIIVLICYIFVALLITKAFKRIEKEESVKKQYKNIIKPSELYIYLGNFFLVCTIVSIVLSFIFVEEKNEAFFIVIILASFLCVICIITVLYAINWRVEIQGYEVIYTNIFRIKRKYSLYSLRVEPMINKYKVYKGNKCIFTISSFFQNSEQLFKIIDKTRRK